MKSRMLIMAVSMVGFVFGFAGLSQATTLVSLDFNTAPSLSTKVGDQVEPAGVNFVGQVGRF